MPFGLPIVFAIWVSESLVQRKLTEGAIRPSLFGGDFTENSVWESMSCEVKTLVIGGIGTENFPEKVLWKSFGRTSVRTTKEPRATSG